MATIQNHTATPLLYPFKSVYSLSLLHDGAVHRVTSFFVASSLNAPRPLGSNLECLLSSFQPPKGVSWDGNYAPTEPASCFCLNVVSTAMSNVATDSSIFHILDCHYPLPGGTQACVFLVVRRLFIRHYQLDGKCTF